MADYLSLEDAAKKLGIPTDKLVELRSQGQVRGFRDGASWKFPENEIERLQDDLADLVGGGSGFLVEDDSELSLGSSIIGGDADSTDDGSGSDLGIGGEVVASDQGGSDVNLVPGGDDGSDVAIVASDLDLLGVADSAATDDDFMESRDLLEIDSGELNLDDPAISHDSAQIDLAIEPNAGSTGPVTDAELKEIAESHPEVLAKDAAPSESAASSLELMSELDETPVGSGTDAAKAASRGVDVLSELDLLSAQQDGSGLISGDSDDLLVSSGLASGSGLGSSLDLEPDDDDAGKLSGIDDALADDDDLVIADDDDDLVISSAGSDISVAGDSGINLMSPSDSGLSLESEPLDLAGSSISALDLGAELTDGSGSGSGGGSGSLVDFQADEDFQLSPSGVGLDADIDSGSQVIEIEDSADAIGEAVEFEEAAVADPLGGDVFGDSAGFAEGGFDEAPAGDDGFGSDDDEAIALDDSAVQPIGAGPAAAYEVPFNMLQCVALMSILLVMGIGGMLMTDLVRNMWSYSEVSAPVSSLTDAFIGLIE